jgi:hypothetical protein
MRNLTLLAAAGLALAGLAYATRSRPRAAPATMPVRNAGPDEMRDPPRRWDRTDEALDETFPASDPVTKY